MGASYGVWCILALINEYWFTNPDIVIAGSWNAGTMSYFVSKQYAWIKNTRINLLSTKKFINFFRFRKIIDIDYLIDTVFKIQNPLNTQEIYNSKIDYYISTTNTKTWKVEYFSNHEQLDIFELMRASKAMPILYWKSVKIRSNKYFDTPNSTSIELKIQKAINLWATKIIAINSLKKTPERFTKLLFLMKSKTFKNNYRKEHKDKKKIKEAKILFLQPMKKLNIWILENNKEIIKETVDIWYLETKSNKTVAEFLKIK